MNVLSLFARMRETQVTKGLLEYVYYLQMQLLSLGRETGRLGEFLH